MEKLNEVSTFFPKATAKGTDETKDIAMVENTPVEPSTAVLNAKETRRKRRKTE